MAVLRARVKFGEVDIMPPQRELVRKNCLEKRVLEDTDSFKLSPNTIQEAVKTLDALTIDAHQKPQHDDTHKALAVVISHPKESIPMLKKAYTEISKPAAKLNYARILAILGDQTGKETPWAAKKAPDWGKGWDYSNQRKYANTYGPIDRIVIALGFLNSTDVHAPLLEKLDQLTLKSPLSHYKAVCLALRMNKDDFLAEPLARFLNEKKLKGHTQALAYYNTRKRKKRLCSSGVNKQADPE